MPPTSPPPGNTPDFGPNVTIFDPSMSASSIQSKVNSVYNAQVGNEFGTQRNALLFRPGTYNVDICSACHPFFTGKQTFIDSAGRVEKFQRKFQGDYFGKKK